MNGWKTSRHSVIFKVLFAAVLVLSITAIPLPQTSGWWQGSVEAAPPDKTHKGQLKRRGIVGVVMSVRPFTAISTPPLASSTPPVLGGSATSTPPAIPLTGHLMVLKMKQHGDVRVVVPDGVRVHAPHQEGISLRDIVGMKVAVLADKPPVDPYANGDDGVVIRTVTAKKVMIVPGEALRTHGRGLVTAAGAKSKGKGKFKLLGEDGEEQDIEIDGADGLEEGDDVIYIKPKKGHRNASSTPLSLNLRGLKKADHIADRLLKFADRLLQATDSPAADRLLKKLEKFQASIDKRLDKLEKHILRLEAKGVKVSPKVHGKLRRGHDGEDRRGKGDGRLEPEPNDDGEHRRGKGNGRLAPEPNDEGDTNRGKGKGRLQESDDGDGDSQGRNRNRNQNRHGDEIDCGDYEDAELTDIPRQCQTDKKVRPRDTSSSSGKGSGKADRPNRGKKN